MAGGRKPGGQTPHLLAGHERGEADVQVAIRLQNRAALDAASAVSNWELQGEFYTRREVEAWQQDTVPHYITHLLLIASARAQAIGPDEIGAQVAQSMYHSLAGHDQPSGLARKSIE